MTKEYFDDLNFTGKDFIEEPIPFGEYTDCQFRNCRMSGTDLSHFIFTDCEFVECDLSNVKLKDCSFKNATFKSCKMLGMHFEDCNEFLLQVNFSSCDLSLSVFFNLPLKGTKFENCNLQDVDFTESNLTNAIFDNSNLQNAVFDNTILELADFRSAEHFHINPSNNILKKSKFSRHNIEGLVSHLNIILC
ncbi:MAG: pentapeptide repeat-containing protein [Marinoscillum sp.]